MSLKEHYAKTVAVNEAKTGGWAPLYYGIFSELCLASNFKVVAEVGVGYGTHAKEILTNTAIDRIYLVDSYVAHEGDGFSADIMAREPEVPGENFNELYALVQNELSPYNERITWLRTPSTSVLPSEIADESLDAVFLDADTSQVATDLDFWWGKLRSGGALLGDDYWMEHVALQVRSFAEKIGQPIEFIEQPDVGYQIYRFNKA
jgi:hypothetical protein